LNELIEPLQSGSRPKGGVRKITEGVPSIGGEHLTRDGGFRTDNLKLVPRDFFERMRRGLIQQGDVLVVKDGATTGKVALVDENFPHQSAVVNEHVFICRPRGDCDSRYLFWYLYSPEGQERILANFQGSAQGGINQSFVKNTLVPLPELEEQHRIASYIERMFRLTRKVRSRIQPLAIALDLMREATLTSAYVQAAEDELGEGMLPISDILGEPLKNGYSARPVNSETPYRVLTLTATTSGTFDSSQFKYTDEMFESDSAFWLRPNDIVVQRGNTSEYVGVPALYEGPPGQFIYPDLMIRVRGHEWMEPKYLRHMMAAPQARNFLRKRATGSAGNMPKINQKTLSSLPVPVASQPVRTAIIQRVEKVFDVISDVRSKTERVESEIGKIESAILREAFRSDFVEGVRVA
jgi:type I restriction enzyme S subunit